MSFMLFLLLLTSLSHASDVTLGLYELDTNAGWAAGFELKENHKVIITPAFGNEEEDYDAAGNSLTKKPDVTGTWKKTNDGIEISYGRVNDYFKYTPNECEYWPDNPCLRHVKSQDTKKEKSILNFEQAWVNRQVKLKPSQQLTHKKLAECESQCKEIASKNQLKQGMTLDSCVAQLCK